MGWFMGFPVLLSDRNAHSLFKLMSPFVQTDDMPDHIPFIFLILVFYLTMWKVKIRVTVASLFGNLGDCKNKSSCCNSTQPLWKPIYTGFGFSFILAMEAFFGTYGCDFEWDKNAVVFHSRTNQGCHLITGGTCKSPLWRHAGLF